MSAFLCNIIIGVGNQNIIWVFVFGENCNAKLIKDTEAIVNDYMNSDKARGLRKFSDLTRLNYSVGVSCRFFFLSKWKSCCLVDFSCHIIAFFYIQIVCALYISHEIGFRELYRSRSHKFIRSIWNRSKAKAWMRTEIVLNECEHFLKANWDRSKGVWTLSQSELRSI